jgi:glutathione synthase/RimK-type ligase-like ATP-grasp enzyme
MIGIHDSAGTFSDRWIEICERRAIPFARVNCLASDAMEQCAGKSAILWHWLFNNPTEQLIARQVIAALEQKGTVVFPNSASCWHYDDKVGQKYLLEAVQSPLIPTWVFTDPVQARAWVAAAEWPKVFKLRRGAGSANVWLVRNRRHAESLCRRAFGRGFPAGAGVFSDVRTRVRKARNWQGLWQKIKRMPQSVGDIYSFRRRMPREQGYVYFQEFEPGNEFDTRITVIGGRALGYIRRNRPGDFRASGSGQPVYDRELIDRRCLEIAFDVSEKLGTQSLAFDFLFDRNREPRISEVSYCYVDWMVHACGGYWDRTLRWHEGHIWPQDAVLEDVLTAVRDEEHRLKPLPQSR